MLCCLVLALPWLAFSNCLTAMLGPLHTHDGTRLTHQAGLPVDLDSLGDSQVLVASLGHAQGGADGDHAKDRFARHVHAVDDSTVVAVDAAKGGAGTSTEGLALAAIVWAPPPEASVLSPPIAAVAALNLQAMPLRTGRVPPLPEHPPKA